jgi:hypothetical protein
MKRFIATLLAIIYFSVSSGMVMSTHYCMGKLSSVNLSSNTKKCGCGMSEKKGCCRTESKLIKLEDAQQKASLAELALNLSVAVPALPLNFLLTPSINSQASVVLKVHPPPVLPNEDRCIKNCVFRI